MKKSFVALSLTLAAYIVGGEAYAQDRCIAFANPNFVSVAAGDTIAAQHNTTTTIGLFGPFGSVEDQFGFRVDSNSPPPFNTEGLVRVVTVRGVAVDDRNGCTATFRNASNNQQVGFIDRSNGNTFIQARRANLFMDCFCNNL